MVACMVMHACIKSINEPSPIAVVSCFCKSVLAWGTNAFLDAIQEDKVDSQHGTNLLLRKKQFLEINGILYINNILRIKSVNIGSKKQKCQKTNLQRPLLRTKHGILEISYVGMVLKLRNHTSHWHNLFQNANAFHEKNPQDSNPILCPRMSWNCANHVVLLE